MLKHPVSALLIDLFGVLLDGIDRPIDGACDALQYLLDRNIPFRIVTNDARLSRREIGDLLRSSRIPCGMEHICSMCSLADIYFKTKSLERCHFLLEANLMEDLQGFAHEDDYPEAVLIGDLGHGMSYPILNSAFACLKNKARLVSIVNNRHEFYGNTEVIGAGAFVAALEFATGIEAIHLNKPSPLFFSLATHGWKFPEEEIMFVGDHITSDIGGAAYCGHLAVLVKTGEYNEYIMDHSSAKAHYIIPSIASLPSLLSSNLK